MEWDSSLYINFVDYEKAFDSLVRDTLWKLLQHYGILDKCISLIRTYRLLHGEDRSEARMSSVTILIDYNK